jgi:nucleoside-diphosphate-sugar epimerase
MEKLLITGASGFIGQALIRELKSTRRFEIYAMTSGRRNVSFPLCVKQINLDMTDSSLLDRCISEIQPSVLIHLAWQMQAKDYLNSSVNADWLSVSLNLMKAFAENKGRRFVFAGSSSEYGSEGVLPSTIGFSGFKESDTPRPSCLFGECKNAFGGIASKYLKGMGIEYAHARVFQVYGPGELSSHIVANAAISLIKGETYTCLTPNNLWDFVYIDDLASDLHDLICSDYTGFLNISGGSPIRIADMLHLVGAGIGREDLLVFENKNKPCFASYANVERMNKVLATPKRTVTRVGVNKTIEWLKAITIEEWFRWVRAQSQEGQKRLAYTLTKSLPVYQQRY